MRYFIFFAYDGGRYSGWQRQPNSITVQEVMEKSISTILRCETVLTGAGRTDAGVHALDMAAHFDVREAIDEEQMTRRMNSLLPPDIAVNRITRVRDDAHARFDALWRRYEYRIATRKSPFAVGRAARVFYPLDVEAMNRCSAKLIGRRDFTSFSKVHTDVNNFVCEIRTAEWQTRDNELVFTIEANRFLRGMVRAIVGTLVEIGAGRRKEADFEAVIEAHDRCRAGEAAEACGLYFVKAEYNL